MTSDQCAERLMAMRDKLFRVSYGLLRNAADREDAVSETVRKALTQYTRLRDDTRFEAWAMRIMIHECYTLLRKKQRELPMADLPERATPQNGETELRESIHALPIELRLPVILHYMDGYALSEISAMLRVPEGTLKSRLSRAREKLRHALTEEEVS